MKITEKAGVLSIMGILLVFIIVITSSYAYFRPTIQGNDTAKRITLSSKEVVHPLYNVMKTLAAGNTYAGTYSGNDTNDTYGTPGTKTIYYIKTSTANDATQASTLLDKINVKFAGMCWQILRTTDTGGVKLIYNGEFTEGTGCKAQNTEDKHPGIIKYSYSSNSISGDYMYSDTFTYNTTTGEFTLVNPTLSNWSTNKNLIGKYTCKNNNTPSTCTELYYINARRGETIDNAWQIVYKIYETQNAQIGTSSFNVNPYSPAYLGYKFSDVTYGKIQNTAPSGIMGNKVYWNGNESNYELQESDGSPSTGTTYNTTHHYMCNNGSSKCADGKVRYYYYDNNYTELTGGDDVEAAISKMLTNNSNIYDSSIKSYLENWYYNNLRTYEDYIEQNAVYCNNRSINILGGWSNNGNKSGGIQFISSLDYGCVNNTDKFSVGNPNAQLKYPLGLATMPELKKINNNNVIKTGQIYWIMTPAAHTGAANPKVYYAKGDGTITSNTIADVSYGVRPVITLKPSREAITGSGTLGNPYVIGENN